MLAVHALWSQDRLCLWGEDSEPAVTSPSEAVRTARPHPFAVAARDLVTALSPAPAEAVTGGPWGTPGRATTAVTGSTGELELLLPSSRRSPLDSPELVRTTPRRPGRTAPVLLPWTVPVVRLEPAAALAWLLDDAGGAGARPGASVAWLRDLARFADELTERGRVLPSLVRADTAAQAGRAAWRPVLQGPDVLAHQQLVTAVPPVCRAEQGAPAARRIVERALLRLVDTCVRERLGDHGALLPPRRGRRPARTPAAEAWLAALTGPHGAFDADPAQLAELERELRPWDEVGTGVVGPARATFRLGELRPDDEDAAARWRLEFLLQSTDDPSLLIPAGQAWTDASALGRWVERPHELLLTELGRASRVWPALSPGLRSARPDGLDLDTAGAHDFLLHGAGALEEAGFGVLVPDWWRRRRRVGMKLRTSTRTDPREAGRFGRDQLCDFEWTLAVGDESLTAEEIAALTATKAPLVQLRGRWVSVDPEQVRLGLEFLAEQGRGRTSAAQVLALAAAHPEDHDLPLEVTGVEADGWLGAMLEGTAAQQLRPVRPPETLLARLRPYQERGLSWLSFLADLGMGACLADDMGLGKTLQLLALETTERDRPRVEPDLPPTLLLCPMSLVANWQAEATRFAPHLRVHAHHGPARLRGEELAGVAADSDLVLTTYPTAVRDLDDLVRVPWHRVVLDEAQAIKNRHSRTARAVRRLEGSHRVALTGTPVENRLGELWSIMDFLNPGLLGSAESFRTRYAVPVERHADPDAAERLRRVTRPYVLRRVKTDPTIIDDLPEKIEVTEHYRLTTEQAALYQSVVDDMMARIEESDGIERRGNVLAAMTKLKQVCNHPAQLLHERGAALGRRSGKVLRLEEITEEVLAEGDRALLFTQYASFAELVVPHLAARFGRDVLYLHGGTSRTARQEMVERFQSGDGPPLFVLSLKAGGTGLNLTAANHVIHLDRWWNPAVENQATDRAFRIGQKRNVQVRKFVGTGTLEEKIEAMLQDKAALADLVVRDGESWLTELSTGDLRELLSLSEGAVGE
ncbi:DEAD/DEAH box helicase [Ornithinimicrobium avium]|uniref:ATP-dependent helicase n=1 Tax=Ornithinimicrobium avium TaxID=2283195 RepID=A0A345NKH5_9MICO|nr:DEAD/DEAH box helicase [Ornithinimicrobium avium]AXH95533.1 ATP-dependent helicase [Ornithinimicrobium avium]